jgi:hypothetical protein
VTAQAAVDAIGYALVYGLALGVVLLVIAGWARN